MNTPDRGGKRIEPHYTATNTSKPAPRASAAPHPDVVAAAELLLTEPDAYLYRRQYLDLITHATGPDNTTLTDYTAAEKYLLTTAAARRKAAHRSTPLRPTPTPKNGHEGEDEVQNPEDDEQS